MAKWCRCPSGKTRVASSIPIGVIYFHFHLFAYFPFLQVDGLLANDIIHDHSPVVIVLSDPRCD